MKYGIRLEDMKISLSSIDEKFLKNLMDIIDKNLSNPDFNVDQLCRELQMSKPILCRKILALTGESPTEFICSYRLKRGAETLKKNFGSVNEVAFEAGFTTASIFAKFIKFFKDKFH